MTDDNTPCAALAPHGGPEAASTPCDDAEAPDASTGQLGASTAVRRLEVRLGRGRCDVLTAADLAAIYAADAGVTW